jgi:hypothetical protein
VGAEVIGRNESVIEIEMLERILMNVNHERAKKQNNLCCSNGSLEIQEGVSQFMKTDSVKKNAMQSSKNDGTSSPNTTSPFRRPQTSATLLSLQNVLIYLM